MADYRETQFDDGIVRTIDGAFIPDDAANADWQTYQQWLADGGVPDPYVPPPEINSPPEVVAWSDKYQAVVGAFDLPPGIGLVVWNEVDPSRATRVALYSINLENTDLTSLFLVAMQPGRVLRIEDRSDSDRFVTHTIESVTKDVYANIVVMVAPRDNALLPFTNTQPISVGVYIAGDVGAGKSVTAKKPVPTKGAPA